MRIECEGCGERIPPKRLEAVPGTTICVHCQEKEEREGRFVRHQMGHHVVSKNGEEVESMEGYLVRGTEVRREEMGAEGTGP